MSRSTPINLFLLIAARQKRKLVKVPKPAIDGELWLSVARNLAHQTAHARDWTEEMPYRISYIDTSMLTDEQITKGILRTEEFPTEPAALARARELLEDVDCKTVFRSGPLGVKPQSDDLPTVIVLPFVVDMWGRHIRPPDGNR